MFYALVFPQDVGQNWRQSSSTVIKGWFQYYDQTLTLGCAALALDYKHALGATFKNRCHGSTTNNVNGERRV